MPGALPGALNIGSVLLSRASSCSVLIVERISDGVSGNGACMFSHLTGMKADVAL